MEYPNHFKYGSPEFIGFIKNLIIPWQKGLLICFQGGKNTDHIKAAQYIVFEIHSRLIKIESSKIVSKYIGETEKNLNRLFGDANLREAIFFFYEADALLNFDNGQSNGKLFELIRKSIDKSKRMVLLSVMSEVRIPNPSLDKIDSIIKFRELIK